jgi:predicted 3-demethylubiquinone-9 3-methyltransferase (glyoxalase superfamily)
MNHDNKIVTFISYDKDAKAAVRFYISIFKNSRIISEVDNDQFYTASFELNGQEFTALTGGPHFTFTEGFSLMVKCDSQEEIDYYWEKLQADGGEPSKCGWLKDKFGVSWQVTPPSMIKMFQDKNRAKAQAAIGAMMKMSKIILKDVEDAFNKA